VIKALQSLQILEATVKHSTSQLLDFALNRMNFPKSQLLYVDPKTGESPVTRYMQVEAPEVVVFKNLLIKIKEAASSNEEFLEFIDHKTKRGVTLSDLCLPHPLRYFRS